MPVFRTVKDARQGSIRLEAIHQPLYDSTTLSASGETMMFNSNVSGRTLLDTNLQTPGALSWPKRFSIRALRQVTQLGLTIFTDMSAYLLRAYYKLNVGEKTYLTIPAFLLTAGTGLEAAFVTGLAAPAAPATGQTYSNHGRPDQRSIYGLIHSIYLPPVQNFNVTLVINTGFTPSASFKMWLFLEGELLREIQ